MEWNEAGMRIVWNEANQATAALACLAPALMLNYEHWSWE